VSGKFPHRAFVEEIRVEGGVRHLVAVYEHNFGSKIHREDIRVPHDVTDRVMLAEIAAAWVKMLSRAVAS
jgi:hypothetical protein